MASKPLREVTLLFLRLGVTAFGGPAAHIAMMRDEVVRRRGWMDDREFMDTVGAVNLIPGPNSTELAIHTGYRRAGWKGLIAAGAAFILPAAVIVGILAWAYDRYGTTPAADRLLYGVKPVIIAVVLIALRGLFKAAIRGPAMFVTGAGVLALALWPGVNELVLLFGGGGAALLWWLLRKAWKARASGMAAMMGGLHMIALAPGALALGMRQFSLAPVLRRAELAGGASSPVSLILSGAGSTATLAAAAAPPFSLATLFLSFLKIGSVLYGSGYVLLAFLKGEFVERLGWLTDQQLLDAIAIGQVTPGPVFTTATFVGYISGGGVPGAVLATIGIFLPAFVFVALLGWIVPRVRRYAPAGAFLDGINAASLGLMAAVTYQLGRASLIDPLTVALGAAALVILLRTKLNSAWLIAVGGGAGLVYRYATG